MADGKYLRLKNVDVSYRFTNNWLKSRVGVESATLSLIGENLHVWDKVKLFDPSQASGNGAGISFAKDVHLTVELNFLKDDHYEKENKYYKDFISVDGL